ncbi:MAG TPA: hypothetical protein VK324_15260, partial [Tepidisphaeraceae bacterium]|nr:hypothetical protein [Tepidisphaeraceae bacterium]
MADVYQPPPELGNLPRRGDKQKAFFDLTRPGPGTPWERRGEFGTVGAFFQTAVRGMTAPFRLTDAVRRPETVNEVRSFALGCGALWAAAVLIHNGIMYYRYGAATVPRTTVDPTL